MSNYVVLWILLLLSSVLPVRNIQAAGTGTLSFDSYPRSPDLYLIDSTGQNLRKLTTDHINKGTPAWSPDGRFFAYHSNDDGDPDIYIMDVRNKTSRQLTNHPDRDSSPAWSPNGKWIAFESDRTGDLHIYRIDVDGSNLMRLTKRGDNQNPAWSPDSQWIAYNSYQEGNRDAGIRGRQFLSVMTADGKRSRQLTEDLNMSGCTWSPDGKQIAFAAGNIGKDGMNIIVIDVNRPNRRALTEVGDQNTWAGSPSWSPDGEWIAYFLKALPVLDLDLGHGIRAIDLWSGDRVICVISPEGQNDAQQLKGNKGIVVQSCVGAGGFLPSFAATAVANDTVGRNQEGIDFCILLFKKQNAVEYLKMKHVLSYAVLWSLFILLVGNVQADGTGTLSFLSKATGNFDIYLVDTQGKIRHHLSTGLANMGSLTWSPDGRFIAYVSNTGGNAEIYVMNVGNRKTRRLTDHLGTDTSPAWSPDGKWIVFTSNRMGDNDIYKVEVTGAKLERLTHQGDNKSPVWSPDSQWIAFVSSRNEKGGLYIMTANGNRVKRLADASFEWGGCTWSPNGTQIAFSAWDPEVEGTNIFIVDSNGKNKHHLTREEPRDLLLIQKFQSLIDLRGHLMVIALPILWNIYVSLNRKAFKKIGRSSSLWFPVTVLSASQTP